MKSNIKLRNFFKLILICGMSFHSFLGRGQTTWPLQGKVVTLDEKPVAHLRIRIEGITEFETKDNGEFTSEIAKGIKRIHLSILDTALVVLAPFNGIHEIPQDSNARLTIVVGKPEREAIKDLIAERIVQLERIIKRSGDSQISIADSLGQDIKKILGLLQLKEEDLRRQIEIERNRTLISAQIMPTVERYIFKLKDLAEAFIKFSSLVENGNRVAANSLNPPVKEYTEAFLELSNHREVFRQAIQNELPEDKTKDIVIRYDAFCLQACDEVHIDVRDNVNENLVLIAEAFGRKQIDRNKLKTAADNLKAIGGKINRNLVSLEKKKDSLEDILKGVF